MSKTQEMRKNKVNNQQNIEDELMILQKMQ